MALNQWPEGEASLALRSVPRAKLMRGISSREPGFPPGRPAPFELENRSDTAACE